MTTFTPDLPQDPSLCLSYRFQDEADKMTANHAQS
jgi:hypothetical protein